MIERVDPGTPARRASNRENALAPLEYRGYDSCGAALSARRRWWLLEWQRHEGWPPSDRRERTGLSATDAWLRAAAGDEMRLSFVVGGVVSFAGVRRLWRLSRPSIVTSIGARTRFQSSVRADAWMLTLSGFHLKSG